MRGTGVVQQVNGTGFQPGETVDATVHSTPIVLDSAVASADGNVTFTFAVPASFELGDHYVQITGSVSGALQTDRQQTQFVVTDAAGQGGSDGGLAKTGLDLLPWVGGSVLAAMLGGLALLIARKRRQFVS